MSSAEKAIETLKVKEAARQIKASERGPAWEQANMTWKRVDLMTVELQIGRSVVLVPMSAIEKLYEEVGGAHIPKEPVSAPVETEAGKAAKAAQNACEGGNTQ